MAELRAERDRACRLTPDRALDTLADAQTFLADRGMLTLTADCALPSLFGACHEEPYQPGGHGFASWPKTKWEWAFRLTELPGVHALKLHRGKRLFLSDAVVAAVDPLCRDELAGANRGEHGPLARNLVEFLAAAGPTNLDDVKRELGLETAALRAVRDRLERVGAIVSRSMAMAAASGERESSELARWDQRYPNPPTSPGGLAELVVAGVRAAVVSPEAEVGRWFSWPLPRTMIDELVDGGKLARPQSGWLALAHAG
jgi:hypothetical protein